MKHSIAVSPVTGDRDRQPAADSRAIGIAQAGCVGPPRLEANVGTPIYDPVKTIAPLLAMKP